MIQSGLCLIRKPVHPFGYMNFKPGPGTGGSGLPNGNSRDAENFPHQEQLHTLLGPKSAVKYLFLKCSRYPVPVVFKENDQIISAYRYPIVTCVAVFAW